MSTPVTIHATGIRFELAGDEHAGAGDDGVAVSVRRFAEFDAGDAQQRWDASARSIVRLSTTTSATSAILAAADDWGEDLLPDLRMAFGPQVTRFAYAAAPSRIELSDALRARLILD